MNKKYVQSHRTANIIDLNHPISQLKYSVYINIIYKPVFTCVFNPYLTSWLKWTSPNFESRRVHCQFYLYLDVTLTLGGQQWLHKTGATVYVCHK